MQNRNGEHHVISQLKAARNLVAAVIRLAVWDATRPRGVLADDRKSARAWIDSNSNAKFSFLWCCEHVNLDPQIVRDEVSGHMQRASLPEAA